MEDVEPGQPASQQPAMEKVEAGQPASQQPAMDGQIWEYTLRKYLLLLATLVVTVTYAAGFNPPGGVWQDTRDGQLAGDPIIGDTHHHRYIAFFYCNATAFAASLVVIVLILILAIQHDKEKDKKEKEVLRQDKEKEKKKEKQVPRQDKEKEKKKKEKHVPRHDKEKEKKKEKQVPRHDKDKEKKEDTVQVVLPLRAVMPLRAFMVLDLLSLMGAYGVGTCRDKISTVYSAVLVAAVFLYVVVLKLMDRWCPEKNSGSGSGCAMTVPNRNTDSGSNGAMPILNPASGSGTIPAPLPDSDPKVEEKEERLREALKMKKKLKAEEKEERLREALKMKKLKAEERLCKVLMLLATFAVSITYVAGLSTPGGFWDSTGGSHRPGDAILKDHHSLRLTVFLLCNTTAFVASLLIAMLLIIDGKKLREKTAQSHVLYVCIVVALIGLVGAYIAGSCRETHTTVSVVIVVILILVGACLPYIRLQCFYTLAPGSCSSPAPTEQTDDNVREALDKARSLVLLLATLAATITYTAGLDPPGGLWQDNGEGHMAGDPILLTTNAGRYKAFFYCNSAALVTSLVAIILVQNKLLVKHHVLEVAMIFVLFGLIGAYAAGSCRDVNTSIYTMAMAGVVLVYVVIHVVVFTLDHRDKKGDEELLEKRRKRLLLFAILAATITYQAGLTPPGGFLLRGDELGHHAGDPVLLYNFPRRYNAFFYCNTVSLMLSLALIILLVNPNLYRPAIRSNALSVCAAVGLFCLLAGYAAGSTQHIMTSIYIFVLVAVVTVVAAGLLVVFCVTELKRNGNSAAAAPSRSKQRGRLLIRGLNTNGKQEKKKDEEEGKEVEEKKKEKKKHASRKYLMLVGILVASVAYQAGLEPPGGAWQSSGNGYEAGNPVMHDNRRPRYLVFFYSNSTSFVASIFVIIMLLPHWLPKKKEEECEEWEEWTLRVMKWTIVLDLAALLVAYAAGSSRGWKTSVYVVALIIAVLGYFAVHMTLSLWSDRCCAGLKQCCFSAPCLQAGGCNWTLEQVLCHRRRRERQRSQGNPPV